jgi:hypothetical protein
VLSGNEYEILVGRLEGKRLFGRDKCRWEDGGFDIH